MGTRADFYIGRGEHAVWIGSVAWDGYPDGFPDRLWNVKTEDEWVDQLRDVVSYRNDFTDPSQGWPWPWDDSATTDYAYAFDDGKVYASSFGHDWFVVNPEVEYYGEPSDENWEGRTVVFPNMRDRQNVAFDQRSGALFFRIRKDTD